MRRHKPPVIVFAHVELKSGEEVFLRSVLLFHLVNVALVVFNRCKMLSQQVVCEVAEETALDKCEDVANESLNILATLHVYARVFALEQEAEGEDAEEAKHCGTDHDVAYKLHEVLHITMADAVVDPGAVMVHLEHTEATLATMVGACRLPSLLLLALFARVSLRVLALEGCLHATGDATRVGESCAYMANVC